MKMISKGRRNRERKSGSLEQAIWSRPIDQWFSFYPCQPVRVNSLASDNIHLRQSWLLLDSDDTGWKLDSIHHFVLMEKVRIKIILP